MPKMTRMMKKIMYRAALVRINLIAILAKLNHSMTSLSRTRRKWLKNWMSKKKSKRKEEPS